MHRLKMILVACVIVTVVATLSLTAGKAKASPLTCGTWSVVNSGQTGSSSYFYGVAAQSNNVWAVGDAYIGTSHSYTLIQNGSSSWGSFGVPGSQSDFLYGVAPLSASNVWSVGYYDNSSGIAQTLIEHWDGSIWSIVSSPNVESKGIPFLSNLLFSVAAVSASDIWAVGEYYTSSGIVQTLIEHWNGSSWSLVSSPNFGSSNNGLYSVTAVSASNVWAVGWYYNGSANQTLIERWDGSSWSLVSSPNRGSHTNVLYSVTALSASNIWAVGGYDNGSANQTLIEHWTGGGWSLVNSPNAGSDSLHGVTALSASNIWAVGYYINGSADQTLTEHWNGSSWSLVSSPNMGSSYNVFYSVASVPGTGSMWAVGYYGTGSGGQTLTEYYC